MGGSAQEWSTEIEDGLVAGSAIRLNLVLTNFNSETATIAYDVVLMGT